MWNRWPCALLGGAPRLSVNGIQHSVEEIERARQATKDAGFDDRLSFEVRDALDNQFLAQAFDSVMLLEMSHLIRDKPKLRLESIRTLKVGGILSLYDLTLQRRLSAKEIVAHHEEIQFLEKSFGKARLETLDYYKKVFEDCGLEEIKITDVPKEVIPTIGRWRDNAEANRATLIQHIENADVDDFVTSCNILEKLYRNGAWGYGLIRAKKTVHHETIESSAMDSSLF